jgi:hypothetical protein
MRIRFWRKVPPFCCLRFFCHAEGVGTRRSAKAFIRYCFAHRNALRYQIHHEMLLYLFSLRSY